jgi:hypothetical protein
VAGVGRGCWLGEGEREEGLGGLVAGVCFIML